eukprot:GHVN01096326.1.p1 GENE.GHVN01096326.1~~GHVN01096326.1.p1  ORF type:complete len:574 (-),score=165.94 GHVN01096326.1:73-1596(-)
MGGVAAGGPLPPVGLQPRPIPVPLRPTQRRVVRSSGYGRQSSSFEFINNLLIKNISYIMSKMGATSCDVHVLDVCASLVTKHIERVASESARVAEVARRSEANLVDAIRGVGLERESPLQSTSPLGASTIPEFISRCRHSHHSLATFPRELPRSSITTAQTLKSVAPLTSLSSVHRSLKTTSLASKRLADVEMRDTVNPGTGTGGKINQKIEFTLSSPDSQPSSMTSPSSKLTSISEPHIAQAISERLSRLPASRRDEEEARLSMKEMRCLFGATPDDPCEREIVVPGVVAAVLAASGIKVPPRGAGRDTATGAGMTDQDNGSGGGDGGHQGKGDPPCVWKFGVDGGDERIVRTLDALLNLTGRVHTCSPSELSERTNRHSQRRHDVLHLSHSLSQRADDKVEGASHPRLPHVHPHMPSFPPLHTFQRSFQYASPYDDVHSQVAMRHSRFEDRLEVQLQLPSVLHPPLPVPAPRNLLVNTESAMVHLTQQGGEKAGGAREEVRCWGE